MNTKQAHIAMTSSAGLALGLLTAMPAVAAPFFFSTGVTTSIATASRPDTAPSGQPSNEIESADDFVLTSPTSITSATFTGLVTGAVIGKIVVEIYQVFPNDSNTGRTSGAPTFSTPNVPTRVNSPSDVALDERDIGGNFTTKIIGTGVTAANSVKPGGIPVPFTAPTGGTGSVTGTEIEFDVNFTTPFSLQPGHYFFVPQVDVGGGDFLWLSGIRPNPTFPVSPGVADLQSWTRDAALEPDWLRIGTDIVGGTTFNAAFSLTGETVPEPTSLALLGAGIVGMGFLGWRGRRRDRQNSSA